MWSRPHRCRFVGTQSCAGDCRRMHCYSADCPNSDAALRIMACHFHQGLLGSSWASGYFSVPRGGTRCRLTTHYMKRCRGLNHFEVHLCYLKAGAIGSIIRWSEGSPGLKGPAMSCFLAASPALLLKNGFRKKAGKGRSLVLTNLHLKSCEDRSVFF